MSNASILERLETKLNAYTRNEISRDAFVKFFRDSIDALEAIPYSIRLEAREHEKAIEIEGYWAEEGFESKSTQAKIHLAKWIDDLKHLPAPKW